MRIEDFEREYQIREFQVKSQRLQTELSWKFKSASHFLVFIYDSRYEFDIEEAAGKLEEEGITVRLGGPTCLSGDVIGDYKFRQIPQYGDLLMFGDMAIYTTCKNNTFNGMPLPDIWLRRADNTMLRLTEFGYADFKGRLGRHL